MCVTGLGSSRIPSPKLSWFVHLRGSMSLETPNPTLLGHAYHDDPMLPQPLHTDGRHGARVQALRGVPHRVREHALRTLRRRPWLTAACLARRARDPGRDGRQGRVDDRDVRDQSACGHLHSDPWGGCVCREGVGDRGAVAAVEESHEWGFQGLRRRNGLCDPGVVRYGWGSGRVVWCDGRLSLETQLGRMVDVTPCYVGASSGRPSRWLLLCLSSLTHLLMLFLSCCLFLLPRLWQMHSNPRVYMILLLSEDFYLWRYLDKFNVLPQTFPTSVPRCQAGVSVETSPNK